MSPSSPGSEAGPSPEVQRLLRLEVGLLRERESRRVFDASVHVGILGQDRTGAVLATRDRPVLDAALRTDVVCRLLEESPSAWRTLWLVRTGAPEPHDDDLAWFSAARSGFGIHDRPLEGWFVLTRSGWRDPLTGASRSWARLRLRSRGR